MHYKIRFHLAETLSKVLNFASFDIINLLEMPKKREQGHLALPVFSWAKERKQSPVQIALDLSKEIAREVSLLEKGIKTVNPIGGYINFTFCSSYLQKSLEDMIFHPKGVGHSDTGTGKVVTLDFSSPNVAKPMHVGHLRATVIGQALYNLGQTQGYEMIGINHLGDWGVQYGRLAWAFKNWGNSFESETIPFHELYSLYVRFHQELENNPDLEVAGSQEFQKLEKGDSGSLKIWKDFIQASLAEYEIIWKRLGVQHDLVRGESFYNDKLKSIETRLENLKLLVESDGAQVVDLSEYNMPPCLIRKRDGSSLYATRDLASAFYRKEDLKADLNLYVVGNEQTLHFDQIFKVLEKMNMPWAKDCHHISFGLYRFKDKTKFSSRKGQIITLKEILDRAVEQVQKHMMDKNPTLPEINLIAEQVGVGAIVFNDLVNDRVKDVEFDWEKALSFDGDSGPYVQYTHVRCQSLIRKYQKPVNFHFEDELSDPLEIDLLLQLLGFSSTLTQAFKNYKPHILAGYLLDLCQSFSHFYHGCKILDQDSKVTSRRMTLVLFTQKVLQKGLSVLSIKSPSVM